MSKRPSRSGAFTHGSTSGAHRPASCAARRDARAAARNAAPNGRRAAGQSAWNAAYPRRRTTADRKKSLPSRMAPPHGGRDDRLSSPAGPEGERDEDEEDLPDVDVEGVERGGPVTPHPVQARDPADVDHGEQGDTRTGSGESTEERSREGERGREIDRRRIGDVAGPRHLEREPRPD